MDGPSGSAVQVRPVDENGVGIRLPRELSVEEVVGQVWANRAPLLRLVVWAGVIAAGLVLLIPVQYESVTRIMPPENQAASLATLLASTKIPLALSSDMLGMKSTGALYTDLLRSRTVQDALVNRFDLRKEYKVRYYQDARKTLNKETEVIEDRKSGVITVVVRDRSPQRAAELARAYTEELDRLVNRVSTSSARQERIFIEQRLASMKDELTSAEKALGQYSSQNMVLNVQDQTKAMVGSLADLQGQLIVAQSQLEGLQQIYTDSNSRIKQLRATVDGLRAQIKKLSGTQADLSHPETLSAGDLYPPVRQMPLLGVQWLDLYRRAKTAEAAYELLAQQYELARVQEAREIPTVKVIDAADVPERKAWPPRTLVVSFSAVAAVFFFIGWITFRLWRAAEGEQVVVRFPPPTRQIPARLRAWVAARRRLRLHTADFSGDSFRP